MKLSLSRDIIAVINTAVIAGMVYIHVLLGTYVPLEIELGL